MRQEVIADYGKPKQWRKRAHSWIAGKHAAESRKWTKLWRTRLRDLIDKRLDCMVSKTLLEADVAYIELIKTAPPKARDGLLKIF